VPIEGAVETLDSLKNMGFKLALVTSASKKTKRKLEREFPDIHDKFDIIVTRSDVKFTKPSPDQLNAALLYLKVERQNAIMIGDFVSDVLAGKSAGVKTVAVLGEFPELSRPILESANPDLIINNITELPLYLLHLFAP
jgi:HAD superfamily hydrolase (TIGR01509 family)